MNFVFISYSWLLESHRSILDNTATREIFGCGSRFVPFTTIHGTQYSNSHLIQIMKLLANYDLETDTANRSQFIQVIINKPVGFASPIGPKSFEGRRIARNLLAILLGDSNFGAGYEYVMMASD